jgi:hypothetical protein
MFSNKHKQTCYVSYSGSLKPAALIIGLFISIASVAAEQYTISTVAEGAPPPTPMPAVNATTFPYGVIVDASDSLRPCSLRRRYPAPSE